MAGAARRLGKQVPEARGPLGVRGSEAMPGAARCTAKQVLERMLANRPAVPEEEEDDDDDEEQEEDEEKRENVPEEGREAMPGAARCTAKQVLERMLANRPAVPEEEEDDDDDEEQEEDEEKRENVPEEGREAMPGAARCTAKQVLERMLANRRPVPEEDEEEDEEQEDGEEQEEASEEEDNQEHEPEDEASSSSSSSDQEQERYAPGAERDTFRSKNGTIAWSSVAYPRQGRPSRPNVAATMPPGPTEHAVSRARDVASAFRQFITPAIESVVLEMTNLEGSRKYGDGWKAMDAIDLRAYVGLLILAGVFRSRGEAAASLWDAESGRPVFRATMPLKLFHTYSRLLRFDDRESRPERRATDKLAAIREVWDKWSERLPFLYNPGPHVTVDEQLVPFRGRCPFRQYMPSKPARYGIKSWVACDAKSSYAWKMQVYTGKPAAGGPEKNQGMRVVLDVTEGLRGHNVTCDNFFTSYELGQRLLARGLTMVGTVRKNKPELPAALLATKAREVFSSRFAYTPSATLVSYLPKRSKNVLLLSTLHTDASVSERQDRKPALILDYNSNKGGVDNLDKVVGTYSCRRMTARWPLAVFHNIIDVSAYNAFVIWRELNPGWMTRKRNKRRVFLEQLGKALVTPLMERRARIPRTHSSAALVKAAQSARAGVRPEGLEAAARAPGPAPASKRKRCQSCPPKKDCKTHTVCSGCKRYVCKRCTHAYCPTCADWGFTQEETD
ncbi:piggyBac transposable element-derived protein 4-like [Esox lucius]|uniref:piggyBac transposable element-derived protein 4-like n=1 Tax=Esox lucius TaxID=8010 RepID=UPI0014775EFB|nr:piggyBac transposable element-derived protein 4-like [Esox lucius]